MQDLANGSIVMITTDSPYYGWGCGMKKYDLALIVNRSSSGRVTTINTTEFSGSNFLTKELKVIEHPFKATFTALGKGMATALLNAPCLEEAQAMAQLMLQDPNQEDFTGRNLRQLTWSVPVKYNSKIDPVLVSVTDELPYWLNLKSLYWKGKDPN